jgi:hypothetical protein
MIIKGATHASSSKWEAVSTCYKEESHLQSAGNEIKPLQGIIGPYI